MSAPSSDQGLLKSKVTDDLAPATGRLASAPASKSKSKWFKSKAQKVFSPPKPSQPAASNASTLAAKHDAVGIVTLEEKTNPKLPLREGPPQSSEDEQIAQESVEILISRPIVELWDEAYDELSRKDKSLVADYEALLFKSLDGPAAPSATVSSEIGRIQRREQMKVLLKRRIKEIEEGEWKLKYKGHELAVKDLVEPVVGVLDFAQTYVGTALESSPYGSLAWAGVCVLLPLVLNPSKQEAARVKCLDYIASIISQCTMREALYHRRYESTDHGESKREFTASHSSYRDALRALYVEILNFQATCLCFLSKNTFKRATADMVKWNDWDTMLDEIKEQERRLKSIEEQWRDMKYEEECKLFSDQHEQRMAGLNAIEDEVSRVRCAIEEARNDNAREKLLDWLSSSVDASENYNSARESHALSTGDWLVEKSSDFKNWETAPNSLLWLHGKAGAGKSVLSSSVIHHIEKLHGSDPHTALAYFYFDFSETEKQNTENMLRALIRQLCGGRPDTPKSLSDLQHYRDKNRRPGLEKLEETLEASTRDFKNVYLIVDALDECPVANGERGKLLERLGNIHKWSLTNLHVLYTSRPEPDIEAELAPLFPGPATSIIDLEKRREDISADISTYIDQKIRSSDFRSWPPNIKKDVKTALAAKADGMFQYVALHLEDLRKAKSLVAVQKALAALPEGLDATYDRALLNIDPGQQEQAIRSLTWLAFAVRPLTLIELAEASIIDPRSALPYDESMRYFSPMAVLDFLPGLVTVVKSHDPELSTDPPSSQNEDGDSRQEQTPDTIRLAHFSIKEYLVSDRIQGSECSTFTIKEMPANISIAEACLICLLQFDQPDSLTHGTIKLPLVEYATDYWTQHAQWATEDTTELNMLIRTFFLSKRDAYINWIRLFGSNIIMNSKVVASPLYYASATGLLELASELLEKEADVDIQGGFYRTPLQAASAGGYDKIVERLLKKGADVNIEGGGYNTALKAASVGGHGKVVKLLLEKKVDVDNGRGHQGTALQAASIGGYDEIVKQLLENGAGVDIQGGFYDTALQAASAGGHGKIVKQLLEKGANVNIEGGDYGTALQAASAGGHDQIVKQLIEKGADVNIEGGNYGTALQAASAKGHDQIVQQLLDKGADVYISGGYYGRALEAALTNGHDHIVEQLIGRM